MVLGPSITKRGQRPCETSYSGSSPPPVGTRNPWVLGSSEPTPEECLRRGGVKPSQLDPHVGSRTSPVLGDDAVNNYLRLGRLAACRDR